MVAAALAVEVVSLLLRLQADSTNGLAVDAAPHSAVGGASADRLRNTDVYIPLPVLVAYTHPCFATISNMRRHTSRTSTAQTNIKLVFTRGQLDFKHEEWEIFQCGSGTMDRFGCGTHC